MKLYRVDIQVSAYVLAESEVRAKSSVHDIVSSEMMPDHAEAREVQTDERRIKGWDGDTLVYGDHNFGSDSREVRLKTVWPRPVASGN